VFSKIEMRFGSHQLKIKLEVILKPAFKTRDDSDVFLDLPMPLLQGQGGVC